jgi:hypothetical protein
MIDDPDIFRAAKRQNGQPATMKQCEQPSACEPKMLLASDVGTSETSRRQQRMAAFRGEAETWNRGAASPTLTQLGH